MINIRSKENSKKKPAKNAKKSVRKVVVSVPRRQAGYFKDAFTSEDIAEMNLFSRLFARDNAK